MSRGEIRQFCKLRDQGQSVMRAAMRQLNLSARAYHRILKLTRTIADLAGSEEIQSAYLAEALKYCPKLMMGVITKVSWPANMLSDGAGVFGPSHSSI